MVALSSDDAAKTSCGFGLRERAGMGLAAAWVLVHLWHASPLPYELERATGAVLYGNTSQERGLLMGFALCLAFVLFPSTRLKRFGWADGVLAVAAGVAGSSLFWNYANFVEQISNPNAFTLAAGACGLLMLFLAALRVFGAVGAILVAFVLAAHVLPPAMGYPSPPGLRGLDGFVTVHWLRTESIFGLLLGIVAVSGFSFVLLGVGLDVMGVGRAVARQALKSLAPTGEVVRLVTEHPCAQRLWALAILFYMTFPGLPFGSEHAWLWDWIPTLSAGVLLYLLSVGFVTWWLRATGRGLRLWIFAGGMLIAAALFLAALMRIAVVVMVVVVSALNLDFPGFFTPSAWLLALAAASVLLTLAAGQRAFSISAFLPIGLYFWLSVVERYSPGLSGLHAALLLLFVMLQHRLLIARSEGKDFAAVPQHFLQCDFLPLCRAQARVMVRVVILAALFGMLLPWTLHLVSLLSY